MSDPLKHECGLALIRLKKQSNSAAHPPLGQALQKMYLLLEKMHNRGQDGAGLACLASDTPAGVPPILRARSVAAQPILQIIQQIEEQRSRPNVPLRFEGDVYLGHVRYGTYGTYGIESCHPFFRDSPWKEKMLCLAGNFNLTNTEDLFQQLVELGQHPSQTADTVTVMERMGHFLDQALGAKESGGRPSNLPDFELILRKTFQKLDGGYAIGGFTGNGHAFAIRDPQGIRPCFWYENDQLIAVASERPALQTVFHAELTEIQELNPGQALLISPEGQGRLVQVLEPGLASACSFERIYFSRGTDADVYEERKGLGEQLAAPVLEALHEGLENAVFSFIPNTAELAFYGLIKGIESRIEEQTARQLYAEMPQSESEILALLRRKVRVEKVAVKDAKLRTFITDDSHRSDLVQHVYDITYGSLRPGIDSLVVVDDSIVRGTTLKESILKMLDRLKPVRILVVSSAPIIKYPDCYGIDMARLADLAAFRALLALLSEAGLNSELKQTEANILRASEQGLDGERNWVANLYARFSDAELAQKMAEQLCPAGVQAQIKLVFQSIEGLHKACPKHTGDWYFSGEYPTPGGFRFVNQAFLKFVQGENSRVHG
jgi:amidophosphoribosyltransferase